MLHKADEEEKQPNKRKTPHKQFLQLLAHGLWCSRTLIAYIQYSWGKYASRLRADEEPPTGRFVLTFGGGGGFELRLAWFITTQPAPMATLSIPPPPITPEPRLPSPHYRSTAIGIINPSWEEWDPDSDGPERESLRSQYKLLWAAGATGHILCFSTSLASGFVCVHHHYVLFILSEENL